MKPSPSLATVPMNDLSRAISRDRSIIRQATESVLDSGQVIMGPQHDAFQNALANYIGVNSVVGVGSGTDALELAIKAAMPPGKSAVVTAANAGGYTSTAARRAGFDLVYADVDPISLCINESLVRQVLSDDVGVVVVTHLYGNLTHIVDLVALCRERGIFVVEDCAQAIGARTPNGAAGSFGDLAAISFYPTKNLGALGDGGAIATNSPELEQRVAMLKQYGWKSKYKVAMPGGTNSRLDEIQAAILLARLPMLDQLNDRRRSIIGKYVAAAEGGPIRMMPAAGPHHVAHLAVARTERREQIRDHLALQGIQTDIHFPIPDHLQVGFGIRNQSLPTTERAAAEVFSLPCFPELSDEEVERVCSAIGSLQ